MPYDPTELEIACDALRQAEREYAACRECTSEELGNALIEARPIDWIAIKVWAELGEWWQHIIDYWHATICDILANTYADRRPIS